MIYVIELATIVATLGIIILFVKFLLDAIT
jgi:hypothetical protein